MPDRFCLSVVLASLAGAALPAMAEPEAALVPAGVDERAYRIDLGSLAGDEIAFDLPGGDRVVGFVTDRLIHDNGNLSWQGIIPEADNGWFSIAAADGVAHGYVDAGGVGVYELKSRGDDTGLHDAVRVDTMVFPPCEGAVIPPVEGRGIPGVLERAMIHDRAQQTATDEPGARGGITTIDVMVVYSAEARIGEGGTSGIEALAQNSINVSNIAYSNSGIDTVELRLVHTEEVDYSETDNSGTDLTRLQNPSDGFMDSVHPTRDAVGADLVALLLDDIGSSCGRAYLSPNSDRFAFSVTDADCAVGNLSFPHELGHNQGCAHDEGNAGSSIFPWGFGWRWLGTNGSQYRSVMAYSPGSRVRQFSNPDVNYVGTPTGTADANNALVIESTATTIAAFRQTAAPACIADTNADGLLSPADFNAWILAYNNASPACDQNDDGLCTPADFNAWILNFNAGC